MVLSIHFGYAQTKEINRIQQDLKKTVADSISYVNKLNRIGMLMHMKNPDSSFVYAVRAKGISQRQNYPQGDAAATNVMAIAFAVKGMQHDAMELFNESLAIYQKLRDTPNIVQVTMNIAVLFSSLEQTENALRYCRKAIKLGRTIPRDSIMGVVYSNYAIVNSSMPPDSLKYFLGKSDKIAQHYRDARVLLVNRQFEASLLKAGKGKDAARPILLDVLKKAQDQGIEFAEISTLQALANDHASQPEIALEYVERALAISDANGYSYLQPLILNDMMHYAELTGNVKKQLEVSTKLVAALRARQDEVALFLSDYIQFDKLKKQNTLLEAKSAADRYRILFLATFSAICLMIIAVIVWLYKRTRKVSRKKSSLNRAIRKKNKQLEETDHFKNRLVSILAHDFRSPLISTISVIEILSAHPDLTPEEMDEFYTRIKNDVSKILDRFDLTLQWIRQQLKGYTLQLEPLQLHELIDDATQNFAPQLGKKNIEVVNNVPADLYVASDKEMLQFINRNLMSNAVKFSPEHGRISIDVALEDQVFTVAISDQGAGLKAESFKNLFSVGDFSGSTKAGAGIALSMCRDFINKLGGEISASNNAEGGATFKYSLPYKPAKVDVPKS